MLPLRFYIEWLLYTVPVSLSASVTILILSVQSFKEFRVTNDSDTLHALLVCNCFKNRQKKSLTAQYSFFEL